VRTGVKLLVEHCQEQQQKQFFSTTDGSSSSSGGGSSTGVVLPQAMLEEFMAWLNSHGINRAREYGPKVAKLVKELINSSSSGSSSGGSGSSWEEVGKVVWEGEREMMRRLYGRLLLPQVVGGELREEAEWELRSFDRLRDFLKDRGV